MSHENPIETGSKPMETLLSQDSFTVQELSTLLSIDAKIIENAVFEKRLKAQMLDHHILSITRHDALAWLDETD
ncbi:MAG: hypothetical protein QM753_17445 [Thermomicrobiales bacterium]